jgi:hypothetical protein
VARGAQCELDIMFNLEKAHFILDEMVMNGCIIETNKNNVLAPVQVVVALRTHPLACLLTPAALTCALSRCLRGAVVGQGRMRLRARTQYL